MSLHEEKGYTITRLCKYFGLSRNGYYSSSEGRVREGLSQELVLGMVLRIRSLMPRVGGKKLYFMLRDEMDSMGIKMGRDKFFSLLRANGLLIGRKRSFTRTTDSYHRFRVHKNLIKDLVIDRPCQVYVSDITYIRLGRKKFCYLFLLTDAFSRKIVGWCLAPDLSITGGLTALKMAMDGRGGNGTLIHHSDRGIQYCSKDYVKLLVENGVSISMTEENHCYENALAERVNGILKDEFLLDQTFDNIKSARAAVKQAVGTYNTFRPHWSLGLRTPQEVNLAI